MKISVCIVGLKGEVFLRTLSSKISIDTVYTYKQNDDQNYSFNKINEFCKSQKIEFIEKKKLCKDDLIDFDIVFFVGWQFLIGDPTDNIIVFHDSLLPKYRGFAPTVTALIKGDKEIGVTALFPANTVDAGPILEQKKIKISHPIKIYDALYKQAELSADLAFNIINNWNNLKPQIQDEKKATYSIWRDEDDFFIDWEMSAEEITRFVYAVGWPYQGAKAIFDKKVITIEEVKSLSDKAFEIRQPGKIWTYEQNHPIVVCGKGMLKIVTAYDHLKNKIKFSGLRKKFS